MSYDSERQRLGRRPVLLVEIDLDKCAEAYAIGACQAGVVHSGTLQSGAPDTELDASASATDDEYNGMRLEITGGPGAGQEEEITDYNGTTKVAAHAAFAVTPDNTSTYQIKDPSSAAACYNTRQTCQDKANYNNTETLTLKFTDTYVAGQPYFHCITASTLAPTIIDPGKGLGIRASIKITVADFPHHDRGVDPYVDQRTYTPESQGTFFSKLVARNRHYIGRPIRVKSGYEGDTFSESDFTTRNYVIDDIEGPDAAGRYTITAKDILKLADDDRAVAPAATTGVLQSSITAGASSLTVTSGTESEYSGEEYVRIGEEIILAPSANRSANVFSNLSRGQFGTTASAHDASDQVQACLELSATNVVDFVKTLLETYAGIPSSYIIDADWDSERDVWYGSAELNTVITKPEGVATLINDLAKQYFFQVWWNEVDQEIIFRPIVPPAPGSTIPEYDDDNHFVADTVKARRTDKKRLTRVLFYFDPLSPIETDDPENYRAAYIRISSDEESADEYGDFRQAVIKGRFVDTESIAVQTAGRMLSRYRGSPIDIEFKVDAKDGDLVTGDLFDVNSHRVQGADGANEVTRFQVMSVREETRPAAGHQYRYTGLEVNYQSRYCWIGPNTLGDYDTETEENKRDYGFIAPDTAVFDSDAGPAYLII